MTNILKSQSQRKKFDRAQLRTIYLSALIGMLTFGAMLSSIAMEHGHLKVRIDSLSHFCQGLMAFGVHILAKGDPHQFWLLFAQGLLVAVLSQLYISRISVECLVADAIEFGTQKRTSL